MTSSHLSHLFKDPSPETVTSERLRVRAPANEFGGHKSALTVGNGVAITLGTQHSGRAHQQIPGLRFYFYFL